MSKPTLCELSNLGLIQASGEDALNFLHGQFTNDLNAVTENLSQLSSYCNPKGRMLSIFRVFMQGNDYFLLMPKDVIDATLKKLTMFKLMAKVDLTDVSDEFVVFGMTGENLNSFFNENKLPFPENINQTIQHNETTLIRIPSENSRVLFIGRTEHAAAIQNSISEYTVQASSDIWQLDDIQSGIPQITADTSEAFIPQMVNLELIGGVNFQKGCYPGQEIVARTHYLGKPNRRMYRISIDDTNCPHPGANIFSVADGEQPVGKIVTAQKTMEETCEALAVLRTSKENADDLHLESLSEPKITFSDLPYSLENVASE